MATDVVTIYNQALSAAVGKGLVASTSENSREAKLCNLWYPMVRDNVLKSASWPCTKKYARLAVLASRDPDVDWVAADPSPGYCYAYTAPSDMLAPRYLHSYARFEWELHSTTDTMAIMSNEELALLHYTATQDDVTKWDNGLEMAVVYALSANICRPLNGKRALAQDLLELAQGFVTIAQTDIANASDDYVDVVPDWLEVRGFSGPAQRTQYFFPYEGLNGVLA